MPPHHPAAAWVRCLLLHAAAPSSSSEFSLRLLPGPAVSWDLVNLGEASTLVSGVPYGEKVEIIVRGR